MSKSVAISAVNADPETEHEPEKNDLAHAASKFGIIGFVLIAGVLVVAVYALVTALTTADFMPDGFDDDPLFATCLACLLPFIVGCIGLVYGITALRVVSVRGERVVAIRGLIFGIVNLLVPLCIAILYFNFDLANAACGGG